MTSLLAKEEIKAISSLFSITTTSNMTIPIINKSLDVRWVSLSVPLKNILQWKRSRKLSSPQLPNPPSGGSVRLMSHMCLRKDQVHKFHQHLNTINSNIHFTHELEDTKGQGLPFLDTITTSRGTQLEVNVYRKPTHTHGYLDFNCHHPMCHKRSVASALKHKTQKGKSKEMK